MIVVRPEEVALQPVEEESQTMNSTGNRVQGIIKLRTFLGPFTRFLVSVDNEIMTADVPSHQAHGYKVGQRVWLVFPPSACQVLPLDMQEETVEQLTQAETA